MHQDSQGQPNGHGNRIEKLEETSGYADRHIEILSAEIAQMNKVVLEMSRRLMQLESRLSELNDRVSDDPGNVPPPHSAGPDIPKEPL
tara:strand:+ start:139253 stop:139516 length:264 start_codon:yes stop_codon:yes gene_type:complete